jgi:hypothetical protein
MDVDHVWLPIGFDGHTKKARDTPEIMDPQPLLHQILDLANQALMSNDKEIINVQNGCLNNVLILTMQHEQSSVDTGCHESNPDQDVFKCAVPNVRRLLQAIKGLSQAEYYLQRSL